MTQDPSRAFNRRTVVAASAAGAAALSVASLGRNAVSAHDSHQGGTPEPDLPPGGTPGTGTPVPEGGTPQPAQPGVGAIDRQPFGTLEDGTAIEIIRLTNSNFMEVAVLTWGGILQCLCVPDREGTLANVSLGFLGLQDYVDKSPYFGAAIGRYANRIARGRFELDGTEYQLPINNDPNTLHGGPEGFDRRVYDVEDISGPDGPAIRLSRVSPDGEMEFPGELTYSITYSLNDANELRIDYRATTDATTVINLTNHTYFNLAGEGAGTILDHVLQLNASSFTPVDETLIPTGEIVPVAGTPFDFTTAKPIGQDIESADQQIEVGGGYDHNWVLDREADGELFEAGTALSEASGRLLTVLTTEPGIQFYSGNFLDGTLVGYSGNEYVYRGGFTMETQHYPDSPNQPQFPSTVLEPGEEFTSTTVFRFSVVD